MARQTINNNESGLAVRNKINENFIELYSMGGSGGAGAIRPPYISGRFYPVENSPTNVTGGSLAANSLTLRPFIIDLPLTLSSISVRLGTASAGGFCRFGIWQSSGTGLPIGSPLAQSDARSTDNAVSLTHTIPVPLALSPGIYWVGYVQDNSVARVLSPTAPSILTSLLFGANSVTTAASVVDFLVNHNFGPLPDLTGVNILAGQNTNQRAPMLFIGVQ